jgi:hypothetical protein
MTDSSIVLNLDRAALMEDAVCIQRALVSKSVLSLGEWQSGISIERTREGAKVVKVFNIGNSGETLRFKLSGNKLEVHGPQNIIDSIQTLALGFRVLSRSVGGVMTHSFPRLPLRSPSASEPPKRLAVR